MPPTASLIAAKAKGAAEHRARFKLPGHTGAVFRLKKKTFAIYLLTDFLGTKYVKFLYV